MFLVLLLLLVSAVVYCTKGQSCPRDSVEHAVYGPGCKYLCHCKDNTEQCDNATGSCKSGCADKWMGPGCQYRDILWRKKARQQKGKNANYAVDGNADTCSSSVTTVRRVTRERPLWWRAWFEQPEIIHGITIITKAANIGYFSRFKVYVEENTDQKNNAGFQRQEICYEHDGLPFLTKTITVICVLPLRGNQIRIQLDSSQTQLVLCDVRAFGGRNLAYSKQTSQSSTFLDRNSSNAVDGSTNTNYQKCAFTDYIDPSKQWTVDLGKVVKVQALELISEDKFNFRSGDIIQAGADLHLYSLQFPSSHERNLFFTTDSSIRYLQIKRNELGLLAICEALVFGDCLDNVCGLDCSILCYCAVFTFDSKVSGECNEGCAAGWTGQGQRCDTECPDGTYGQGCSGRCKGNIRCDKRDGSFQGCKPGWKGDTCNELVNESKSCAISDTGSECQKRCSSHCLNDDICVDINGHCPRGCAAGWMGDKCDTECAPGSYGLGCMKLCNGHCLNNIACDNVRGHCPQGCAAGWMGDKCDKECPDGKYGSRCSQSCSGHCLKGRLCNKTNGHCDDGCSPGWRGNTCNFKCYYWYYGYGCQERCSGHCLYNDICNNVDGNCPRGCAAGWIGDKCDAECSHGFYGVNCLENCSLHCKDERMCDKTNGRCVGGCKAGWQGLTCLRECKNGTYGAECSGHCSGHCLENGICDNVDGHCSRGCAAGWKGQTCDTEIICPVNTFGLDCTPCGLCKNGSCDPVTGECPYGCFEGYVGSMCETFNVDAMYTVNAGLVGAGVGVAVTLLVVAVIVAVLWKIKQRPHIYEEPLSMTSSGPTYDICQDQGHQKENDSDQEHVYVNEM